MSSTAFQAPTVPSWEITAPASSVARPPKVTTTPRPVGCVPPRPRPTSELILRFLQRSKPPLAPRAISAGASTLHDRPANNTGQQTLSQLLQECKRNSGECQRCAHHTSV